MNIHIRLDWRYYIHTCRILIIMLRIKHVIHYYNKLYWRADGDTPECANALGRVSDIPDFDEGGGNSEDQAGTVVYRHYVVGVPT